MTALIRSLHNSKSNKGSMVTSSSEIVLGGSSSLNNNNNNNRKSPAKTTTKTASGGLGGDGGSSNNDDSGGSSVNICLPLLNCPASTSNNTSCDNDDEAVGDFILSSTTTGDGNNINNLNNDDQSDMCASFHMTLETPLGGGEGGGDGEGGEQEENENEDDGDGDGAVDEPNSDESIDDYERVCTVGTGTFGRVYLVKRKWTDKYYALKAMSIKDVVAMKQIEHVHSEKRILQRLNHPFVIRMFLNDNVVVMPYKIMKSDDFSVGAGQFYTAEIVSALEYLHTNHIVYRDLKPENIILDREGHIRLTDFGFAKELNDRTWTLCGTPEYLAPEIIESRGHNRAVDWWSLGVLIFEMLSGYPPFRGDNALQIYENIIEGRVKFPKTFDLVAKDLVKKFLVSDRTKRLGNMKGQAEDVKNHKWFRDMDWDEIREKKLKPPIIPKVFYEGDCGNFDEYEEEDLSQVSEAGKLDLDQFTDW